VTFIDWIIARLIVWLVGAAIVGILTGRAIRGPGHHYPSPNHQAMRAHKQLADGRPLNPYETAVWKQCEDKLKEPT